MRGISELTGPESYVLKLMPALAARGCASRLLCITDPARPEPHCFEEFRAAGLDFAALPVKRAFSLEDFRALPGFVRRFAPDVIHTLDHRADIVGWLAGRLTSIPCVATFMGWSNFDHADRRQRLYRRLDGFALRRMGRVISDTACNGAVLGLDAHDPHLSIIPFGVDTDRFRPLDEPAERRTGNGLVFGTVGRIHPQKDQLSFVEAAATVLREDPAARFVIVGQAGRGYDGYEAAVRQRAGALGLDAALQIIPSLPQSDMPALLSEIDVLVAPFLHSGVSFTVFEAMASGLPVIATENTGSRTIVGDGDCGLLVPGGDSAALADAMRRILRTAGLRAETGGRARAKALSEFSVDAMAKRTLRVYRAVAEPAGHKQSGATGKTRMEES